MLRAIALTVVALVSPAVGQSPTSVPEVQTPIVYGRGMFVCVGEQGVAAVRILKPTGTGNETGNGLVRVKYQWRFLSAEAPDAEELTGSGTVVHKLEDGRSTKASSGMKLGPLAVQWQYRDQRTGLIKFNPDSQRIYVTEESEFGGLRGRDRQPLQLKTFLAGKSPNGKSVENQGEQQLAALVSYKGTSTLVKGPRGVAIFEFGEVFHRERPPLEMQHGVKYSYTYFPYSGKEQTGEGVLYESYKENRYNGASSALVLRGGPADITWSQGGDEDGFLYYDPSQIRIQTCNTADIEKLLRANKLDRSRNAK